MTKPDILFGRDEVESMCRKCHGDHKNPQVVQDFREHWLGRSRPNGRTITSDSICTDCHGTHNIVKEEPADSAKQQPEQWIKLFNGKNLQGWSVSGSASWEVNRSSILARPGPENSSGELLSEGLYRNYLLSVTFKAEGTLHAGIWLRFTEKKPGPRIEILQDRQNRACTGSLWIPQKGLSLLNLRNDLYVNQGWNTISARVEQNKVIIWLNGEEIGSVCPDTPSKGRIGLHLEEDNAESRANWRVREILLKPLE